MESEEKSLFQKLREHPTFRASSTYAVIAFITVQVISLIVSSFSLSESIIQGFIWASIIGFPIDWLKIMLVDIIKTLASNCASKLKGM